MTLEEAVKKIQSVARMMAKKRREAEFRQKVDEFPVLSWSVDLCYLTGNIDILIVHALQEENQRCWAVRFTIFDYVSKIIKFQRLCNKIQHVEQFTGIALRNVCLHELSKVGWEAPPFQNHVTCIQRMINENLGDVSHLNEALFEKKSQKLNKKPTKQHLSKVEFSIYSKNETDNGRYSCKIKKRVRPSQGRASKMIHDWQIQLIQHNEPKSSDYLVLRRLPVPLGQMKSYLDLNLDWKLNKQVIPFSILYLELKVQLKTSEVVVVRSQRFHDMADLSRFNLRFNNSFFFNYNHEQQGLIEDKEQEARRLEKFI